MRGQNHLSCRAMILDIFREIDAVGARQHDVAQSQIDDAGGVLKALQSVAVRCCADYLISSTAQNFLEEVQRIRIGVGDENCASRRHSSGRAQLRYYEAATGSQSVS